jgi:hypothetical protein
VALHHERTDFLQTVIRPLGVATGRKGNRNAAWPNRNKIAHFEIRSWQQGTAAQGAPPKLADVFTIRDCPCFNALINRIGAGTSIRLRSAERPAQRTL